MKHLKPLERQKATPEQASEQFKEFRLRLEEDWCAAVNEIGTPFRFLNREHYWLEVEKAYIRRASKWAKPIAEAWRKPAA